MALSLGEVSVDFVASLDKFFKGLDKVAAKLEGLTGDDAAIKLQIDDAVLNQLERVTVSVENLSDLADTVKNTFLGIFDSLDGKVGNLAEQIEQDLGKSVKNTGKLAEDGLTRFTTKVSDLLSRISPLAVAQAIGVAVLIERIVTAGFSLKAIIPGIGAQLIGVFSSVKGIGEALHTMNLGKLVGALGTMGSGLLSITSIAGLLLGSVRGITALALGLLQKRPEGRLQAFTQLIGTLNKGVNDLLLKSERMIGNMLLVSATLVTISTTVFALTGAATTGLAAVSALVVPISSGLVLGLALMRRLGTAIQGTLLRFRAAAGDGRAQTVLFLQALRGMFPILQALSNNAKPIAKAITRFVKGGLDSRLKQVMSLVREGVQELKNLTNSIRMFSRVARSEAAQVNKAMQPVLDKGAEIKKQMGRKGARDAVDGLTAVKDVLKGIISPLTIFTTGIKTLGGVVKLTAKAGTGFIRGFFGKDGLGLADKAARQLSKVAGFIDTLGKKALIASAGLRGKVRDRLVDIFQNAEKPVLKEIGDLALASSNVFLNTFAMIVNPVRALLREGLSFKGVAAATWALGAAMGKTLTSSISVAFKVGSVLFKAIGAGFDKLFGGVAGKLGTVLKGVTGGVFGAIGGAAGAIGGLFKGRTGVAAKDPEERKQRKADELRRQQLAQLEAKQTKEVIEVNKEAVRLFNNNKDAIKAAGKALGRMSVESIDFSKDLDGVPLDKLRQGIRDQVAQYKEASELLEKVDTDYDKLRDNVRKAAKATKMSTAKEQHLLTQVDAAARAYDPLRKALKDASPALNEWVNQIKDTGGEFTSIDLETMRDEVKSTNKKITLAGRLFKEYSKALEDDKKAIEARTKAGKGLGGRRAKDEKLLSKVERKQIRAAQMVTEGLLVTQKAVFKTQKAELERQTALKETSDKFKLQATLIQKSTEGLGRQIRSVDKLSTAQGKAVQGLQKAVSGFGGASVAKAAEEMKKSGRLVVSKLDQQASAIEAQIKDSESMRARRGVQSKQLQNEIAEDAKRSTEDKELLLLQDQLATVTGEVQKSLVPLRDANKNLVIKTNKAAGSFDALASSNEAARKSMAEVGKSVQRSQGGKGGDIGSMGQLISQIMSGPTKKGLTEGGAKGAGELKNNPIFKFFKELEGEAANSSEVIAAVFGEMSTKTLGQVDKLRGGLKKLQGVIKRASDANDFQTLDQIIENFGIDSLEAADRLFKATKGFTKAVNQVKKAGSSSAALGGEQKNIIAREIGASLKKGLTDAEEIIQDFQQRVQRDPKFSFNLPRVDKAKFKKALAEVLDAAENTFEKQADSIVQPLADRIKHSSPPKKGPLRDAELSFRKFGPTMMQQAEKGKSALARGMDKFLKPIADRIHFKSPPLIGPLKVAVLSMSKMGSTIGKLIMKGVGPLQGLFNSFLNKVFGGPLSTFLQRTATELKDLGLTANRLRLDPNQLHQFNEAIALLGGNAQDAESTLTQLVQTMDRAIGEGAAGDLAVQFSRAGISLRELKELSPDQIFMKLSKAINEAQGDAKLQSELLRLVGAEFTNMRGVILEGTDAIAGAFSEVAKRPPLTDKTIETAKEFTTQMARIEQTLKRIGLIIFEEVAPAVRELTAEFSGGTLPSINQILETVRAGVRIGIRSIKLIVEFIRKRWIEANDGLNNFLQDIAGVGKTVMDLLRKMIQVFFDKAGAVVSAALDMIWARINGQTKSMLGGLLVSVLGLLQTIGSMPIALIKAVWEKLKFFGRSIFIQVQKGAIQLWQMIATTSETWAGKIFAFLFSGISNVVSIFNEAADFLGLDSMKIPTFTDMTLDAGVATQAIKNLDKEMANLKDEFDVAPTFGEDFIKTFDGIDAAITSSGKKLQKMIDTKIAKSEMKLALDDILKTSENAGEQFERMQNILKEVAADDALVGLTDATTENLGLLRQRLTQLAKDGFIDPGAVTEGRARLIKETTSAFMEVGGEAAKAFQDAFGGASRNLKDLSPEVFALGMQLKNIADEELAQIQVRLAKLKEEGLSSAAALKKVFLDTNVEAKKVAETFDRLTRRRALADMAAFGRNMVNTMRDMAGAVGPFEEANRKVTETFIQMDEAMLSIDEKFRELGDDYEGMLVLAEQFGVHTADATRNQLALAQATDAVVIAQAQLAAIGDGAGKGAAQARLKALKEIEKNMRDTTQQSFADMQGSIHNRIKKGFEDGAEEIRKGPMREVVQNNLVGPVLDGFKNTVKGLVDGSLMEAARAAQGIAEQTGQKFSQVLFVIGQFGQQIFENAFNSLLDDLTTTLTKDLSKAIGDSFTSGEAKEGAEGLSDLAGGAIGAAMTAALAVVGLILSRLQSSVKASKESIKSIVDSTEAVRGVISGSTTVAIKEVQDTLMDANRPVVVRLDELIRIGRTIAGTGGNIPGTPLSGALGSTTGP